jgi:hypothetical protein
MPLFNVKECKSAINYDVTAMRLHTSGINEKVYCARNVDLNELRAHHCVQKLRAHHLLTHQKLSPPKVKSPPIRHQKAHQKLRAHQ